MISIFRFVKNYITDYYSETNDITQDEETLEKHLRFINNETKKPIEVDDKINENDNKCVKRSGKITRLTDEYGVIDNNTRFLLDTPLNKALKLKDVVNYFQFANKSKDFLYEAKIISKIHCNWDDGETIIDPVPTSTTYDIIERVVVGKVKKRHGRNVIVDPNNLTFSLDTVVSNFIPIVGDWIELAVKAQDDNEQFNINLGEILEVISIRCVRSKAAEGVITKWNVNENYGEINHQIYINKLSCNISDIINPGDKVIYDAIESEQGYLSWRALSVVLLSTDKNRKRVIDKVNAEENCHGIFVSNNFDFGIMNMGERKKMEVEIRNDSNDAKTLIKTCFHSKLRESQLRLLTPKNNVILEPNKSIILTFECLGKYMGFTDEVFVFTFRGFKLTRIFKINITDIELTGKPIGNSFSNKGYLKNQEILKNLKCIPDSKHLIRGERVVKPPPFIKLRLQQYKIPPSFWNYFFEHVQHHTTNKFMMLLEKVIPELGMNLSKNSYKEKFHHLLYLEEIHEFIRYKNYDMSSAYLEEASIYLSLQIEGLFEKRPSLQIGDTVRVKSPWGDTDSIYEAYIHKINSNSVYLKFDNDFHSKYRGEAVSVEFFFSRSAYQKSHFAIDLAFSHLGPQVLFPDHINIKESQIDIYENDDNPPDDKKNQSTKRFQSIDLNKKNNSAANELRRRNIKWFNQNLNIIQKVAVKNVLYGKARPLPYVIFGPPGTGKTVTLVEIIMQLFCLIPESRLLISTPSNSASNLLAERLISVGKFQPGSLIRLVSNNYVENGKIADNLKPYCATVNISVEKSNKSNFHVNKEGIQYGCGKSYVGRHRITIGTCVCISSLAQMGFPAGHFTHVLVDEAGQATEPEVMMALTFVDKSSGQLILSGDPLQLGPVVISNIASKFGLVNPYLERLLTCFPYQKDFESYGIENGGFDPRLVTKLTYNYRSLQQIIDFSSKSFYDNGLISKIDINSPWIQDVFTKISRVFDSCDKGIIFHGVRGVNYRGEEEPSWYNPHEASMVLLLLCKLYKNDFTAEDIGIITPYTQQVKHINSLINDMGIPTPKIGSVEEFQGQERRIVIMSTVRSNETLVQSDIANYLGFINNAKRVNVALTRAQILLVIFGNPHLLVLDPLWCSIIKHAVNNDAYIGCDLPSSLL